MNFGLVFCSGGHGGGTVDDDNYHPDAKVFGPREEHPRFGEFLPHHEEFPEHGEEERDRPFGFWNEVNPLYCEEYDLNCHETCCAGIVCADSKDQCIETYKRPFKDIYIGIGVLILLIFLIPVVIKNLDKLITFEVKSVSLCFLFCFCLFWPCCVFGLCLQAILKASRGGPNIQKPTLRDYCCFFFCLRGQGLEEGGYNKVYAQD